MPGQIALQRTPWVMKSAATDLVKPITAALVAPYTKRLGFKNIIDALGGIDVCIKKDIDDSKSHLKISAGLQTLNGIDSLKYVRTRQFDGLGDIGRMKRQQEFMSAVLRKATSTGTLLNPIKLVNFFNAAIKTVTTDKELDKNDLLTLGKQLKNLSADKVRTLTIPLSNANGRAAGVGSVVIWDKVLAPELFTRLMNDQPIFDEVTATPSASASPTTTIVDKFKSEQASNKECASAK